MLRGINPLLTGELLLRLDRLGHSDLVVISDAHFPAYRVGRAADVLDIPSTAPAVARAVRSVIELDDVSPVTLMDSGGAWNEVQSEIVAALEVSPQAVAAVDRYAFYEVAAAATLIVRTAEIRTHGNVILSRGLTPAFQHPGA